MESLARLDEATRLIAAGGVVTMTGAGVSVESGIPDFRSPGGLWERFNPMEYATIDAFRDRPRRVWNMFHAVDEVIRAAEPNPAHVALAELEKLGVVKGVVTQNIDGLHTRAGSREVVEVHGGSTALHCLWCGSRYARDDADWNDQGVPICSCGKVLKPEVVLFGEMLPDREMRRAQELVQGASTLLVIGTSALVYPAAGLLYAAQEAGARIVEVNIEHSEITDDITDVFLQGPAGTVLPRVLAGVRANR